MTQSLFAGIPVTEYAAALPWYEQFFGGQPSFLPTDIEAVREAAENRCIYIVQEPERAGNARTGPGPARTRPVRAIHPRATSLTPYRRWTMPLPKRRSSSSSRSTRTSSGKNALPPPTIAGPTKR